MLIIEKPTKTTETKSARNKQPRALETNNLIQNIRECKFSIKAS